jgi:putative DNA primase/helicase
MANSLEDVAEQMRGVGLSPPKDLSKALGGYVRWKPDAERRAKKNAWVRLFEWSSPTTSRTYITGAYGWASSQWLVESATKDWSPEERSAELAARKEAEKAARELREQDAATAAAKAARMWSKGRAAEQGPLHPYLERKKVGAFDLRVGYGNKLLVPMRDTEGKLHGLQYISDEGDKIFGTGTAKEGKFHLVGNVVEGVPIGFAEGYATAASAHMATGWPVVACFDAGNLDPVVTAWRKLYPDHQFVMLGDDDRHLMPRLIDRLLDLGIHATASELAKLGEHEWIVPPDTKVVLKAGWSKDGGGVPLIAGHIVVDGMPRMLKLENAGRSRATAAARKVKGVAAFPAFPDAASKGSDWNDLQAEIGLEAVRKQILAAIEVPPGEKTRATDTPQGGGKKAEGVQDWTFLERFTLIYGTTTVWDAQERAIIRLESMKAAFGKTVDWWLGHGERRMVSQANVIFDPTGRIAKPDTHVNLFDALPIDTERPGECDLIIKHLFNLCGEDDRLFNWVTSWLAYPLKHLGTKMRTSLIVHGRQEGTGKSLMMDIMRRIYGRYSRSITQTQLQSEFNGWQSGMLFCVAEEVVSASERKNLKNLIQNMITNEVIQINEKNMPVREEASYANFVFLSNEQLPMLLNETDRRYTVIQVEQKHDLGYFKAIGEQMDNGGVEAFYRWLIAHDLGEFTLYTLPFETKARLHLITLGMSPDQRFMLFWSKGLAGLPFVSAPARDLYTGFRCWCRINGERFIASSTQFGRTASEFLDRMGAPPKKPMRFDAYSATQVDKGDWDLTSSQQGVVYFVPAALQRLAPGADVADGEAALEDVRDADVYNRRIKQFQTKLHDLVDHARRAF